VSVLAQAPNADLALTKTAAPNPVPAGENLTYTLAVRNIGPQPATGVTVTDTLPAGVTFVSASSTQGNCNGTSTIACNLGNLAASAPGNEATITIVVRPTATGTITNTASVTGNETDPNMVNNTAAQNTNVVAPDLTLAKTHTGNFTAGTNGAYNLTVTNAGSGAATGAITVTDPLPAGLSFVSGAGAGWNCSATGQNVTCINAGPLAAGANSSFTLTVAVSGAAAPSVTNTASVATPGEINTANNAASDPTNVVCTYSILPTSQSFTAAGGADSVNVTSSAGCAWTAASNDSWLTITSGGSGSGNGTVNYSVAANPSTSPRPGTVTIAGQTFTVNQAGANPVPTIAILDPSSAVAGSAGLTLTITGSNFIAGSVVRWNGADRTTTFVSATQLTASIAASDIAIAGTASVTVFNPAPGGGNSNALSFTINNPVPATTSLNPSAVTAGGAAFTLTVTGTNFVNGSVVRFSGSDRPTTFVSNTQLTATITVADIATAGAASITVFNPAPGGGTSNAQTLTINNPAPTLTSITPNSVLASSGAFTLTVNGTNFVNGSVVRLNGSDRVTTFASATQLTAAIPAADVTVAGAASITVFNPAPGGGLSNALSLTIARILRLGPASAPPGSIVRVPIELLAQGNENALGFSLTFDPFVLSNPQAALGADAAGATLNANSSQAAQGRFGLTLALPAGQSLAAGTRQVVVVSFAVAAGTTATSTPLEFADQPVKRELVDLGANLLPLTYISGTVTIAASQGYEADVTPRPDGNNNGTVTTADWVQVGRFAAGLDAAAQGSEFQRADNAPRETLGDGRLTTADWVQAGRYAAGLDAVAAAGGPTSPTSSVLGPINVAAQPSATEARTVRLAKRLCQSGSNCTLAVELDAQGDENALGLSLQFDPSQLRFVSLAAGPDASGAVFQLNSSRAAQGRVGIMLALPAGASFAAGTRQVIEVIFALNSVSSASNLAVGFGDLPVTREVVSADAKALNASCAVGSGLIEVHTAVSVSAASFSAAALSSEAIAAAFGANLASVAQPAETLPLPTRLGGTQVLVKDSAGVERLAPLFYVSPGQVNYLMPGETATGEATVIITSGDGSVSVGTVQIAAVAPGLFAANANGQGVAAALALRVKSDGSQSYEPVAAYDPAQNKFVARPVDLGPESDQVVLVLFGTGLHHVSPSTEVSVQIGGVEVPVLYAGPQGGFVGLDQINVSLTRNLIGRGEVDVVLVVDGKTANTVKVHIR
jgi:uncharacterized protein (TIGR03437 family)